MTPDDATDGMKAKLDFAQGVPVPYKSAGGDISVTRVEPRIVEVKAYPDTANPPHFYTRVDMDRDGGHRVQVLQKNLEGKLKPRSKVLVFKDGLTSAHNENYEVIARVTGVSVDDIPTLLDGLFVELELADKTAEEQAQDDIDHAMYLRFNPPHDIATALRVEQEQHPILSFLRVQQIEYNIIGDLPSRIALIGVSATNAPSTEGHSMGTTNTIMGGESGIGKSLIQKSVFSHIPGASRLAGGTPKALIYEGEPDPDNPNILVVDCRGGRSFVFSEKPHKRLLTEMLAVASGDNYEQKYISVNKNKSGQLVKSGTIFYDKPGIHLASSRWLENDEELRRFLPIFPLCEHTPKFRAIINDIGEINKDTRKKRQTPPDPLIKDINHLIAYYWSNPLDYFTPFSGWIAKTVPDDKALNMSYAQYWLTLIQASAWWERCYCPQIVPAGGEPRFVIVTLQCAYIAWIGMQQCFETVQESISKTTKEFYNHLRAWYGDEPPIVTDADGEPVLDRSGNPKLGSSPLNPSTIVKLYKKHVTNISRGVVYKRLEELEKLGYITRIKDERGIVNVHITDPEVEYEGEIPPFLKVADDGQTFKATHKDAGDFTQDDAEREIREALQDGDKIVFQDNEITVKEAAELVMSCNSDFMTAILEFKKYQPIYAKNGNKDDNDCHSGVTPLKNGIEKIDGGKSPKNKNQKLSDVYDNEKEPDIRNKDGGTADNGEKKRVCHAPQKTYHTEKDELTPGSGKLNPAKKRESQKIIGSDEDRLGASNIAANLLKTHTPARIVEVIKEKHPNLSESVIHEIIDRTDKELRGDSP